MSMTTLRLMQESYAAEDRAMARTEKIRATRRKVTYEGEELEAKVTELVAHVVKSIPKALAKGSPDKMWVDIPATPPTQVVKEAIARLKAKGLTAKHAHNDGGYPNYDAFVVKFPEDWVERVMR